MKTKHVCWDNDYTRPVSDSEATYFESLSEAHNRRYSKDTRKWVIIINGLNAGQSLKQIRLTFREQHGISLPNWFGIDRIGCQMDRIIKVLLAPRPLGLMEDFFCYLTKTKEEAVAERGWIQTHTDLLRKKRTAVNRKQRFLASFGERWKL